MKILNFTIIFCLFITNAFSQKATVKGFVYDEETAEPVIFTNVFLKGTTFGSSTDVDGIFTISQIPPGDYILSVILLGYDTLQTNISLAKGEIMTRKLYLRKAAYEIKGIYITADGQENITETRTSVVTINPKRISQIPTAGGIPDLAQYLQVLPGVIFTGDQGGQLYIRGGSPVQNKVLLDGMIIYNPFHSIGLFSVFDTDILRSADVYTGGFGAEYGGRISSIMDITTRDGNKKKYSGKIDVTTFGAKALVEGPLKKYEEGSEGSSSFIFSAKKSYLQESSKFLYSYIDTAGLPFNYTDLYGKISINSSNGSKFNVFGFNFSDNAFYREVADFKWDSYGGGTNFVVIPQKSTTLIKGNFAYSSYSISLDDQSSNLRTSKISGFNSGLNFTYFPGKGQLDYGIELLGFNTEFHLVNTANRVITQDESTTEFAVYVKYRYNSKKLIVEPSFRAHEYASQSDFSPEPRLSLKYVVTKNFRLKFAGGYYSQNLISTSSDRDVVNLFTGFVSGPDNLQDEFDGDEVTHNLQKARHYIFGVEIDLFKHLSINIEGYYKYFNQLTNLNRNKIFDDNNQYEDMPDLLKKDFIIEKGDAEGVDFTVKYDNNQLYIWAVYSLGYIHRYDGIDNYPPHYDRRHNINIVGAWTFGKQLNWEFNTRWNLGSGFAFTQIQGFYENITFDDGIYTDYVVSNGDIGVQYGEINQGRLPYYHRLDVTLKRNFLLSETANMEANVGITNAYNRQNIFYYDALSRQRIDQLPFMPFTGISLKF